MNVDLLSRHQDKRKSVVSSRGHSGEDINKRPNKKNEK